MAIFSFSRDIGTRSKGQSAIAAAAYRHRTRLEDTRTGEAQDYSHKPGLLAGWIQTPDGAPAWMRDRAQLWNAVEAREDRSTRRAQAQLYFSDIVALPHELTLQQSEWLLRDFIKENYTRKGQVADVAIHAPDEDGDQRNMHAHIMSTMRRIEDGAFTGKLESKAGTRGEQTKARQDELQQLRERWAHHVNRQLERHGFEARIDHRSHDARGIGREPTQHVGVTATGMERRGVGSERGGINAGIEERNALRAELREIDQAQRRLDRHMSRIEAIELERQHRAEAERAGREPRGTTQYALDRLAELGAAQAANGAQAGQERQQEPDTQDDAARAAAARKAEEEAFYRAMAEAQAQEDEQGQRQRP